MLSLAILAAALSPAEARAGERFLLDQLHGARTVLASVAQADLNGDGRPEVIAYVTGPEWCGSGGCRLMIATRTARGWRLVARTTVTRPPIRRLATRRRGWSDLAVGIGGGGLPARTVRLRFDGARYPSNPTTAGVAMRALGGVVLIDNASPQRTITR